MTIEFIGQAARAASRAMARATSAQKDAALEYLAAGVAGAADEILKANRRDMELAEAAGHEAAFLDRLELTPARIEQMAEGVRQVRALPDPVGVITDLKPRPSGIQVGRMRMPLGVIAMIYEARPNVTIDAAALAIKSGNALILRGGSEALRTSLLLADIARKALEAAGLPADALQMIDNPDRALVGELIRAREWVDVLIPRGGKSLIARLSEEATVPMIKHLDGVCTTYIDRDADIDMAVRVADNAKTQRFAPCNATENLLVHRDVAFKVLPMLARIFHDKDVEMRCDQLSRRIVEQTGMSALDATEEDWSTEYNAPVIAIKVVENLDEAINFIAKYGSGHTDAIITENRTAAERFLREVDSSSVMVNASTRFADGFEYGLGAEIGISTDKIHVRGPVGLEGLTSEKWIVLGHGEGRR